MRKTVRGRRLAAMTAVCCLLSGQDEPGTVFRANVRMVVLPFSVTDGRGRAVRGLTPDDVRIFEDGIPQQIAAFMEGSRTVPAGGLAGASVFVLFDTSNRMYSMFPYVYDAVGNFVRRLDPADSVAVYTFSRNLSRASRLTRDHVQARAGMVNTVAGDDTALFNAILLTLRDAARVSGRKAVVVFSNGPDNASVTAPDDVARVAEDEGIPVYIISTQDPARDAPLAAALKLLTGRSGGKLYWAPRWQDQDPAFRSVLEDIDTSYTLCYYPLPDSSAGFRRVEIRLTRPGSGNWRVRARAGYETPPRTPGRMIPRT